MASFGSDSLTILRSHGRLLAKTIHADGTINPYDSARTFDLIEQPADDLDAIEQLLRRLEGRRDCGIVRGAIADPTRTKGVRRLLYADGADPATLCEVPRRWVALDIDGYARPAWLKSTDLLSCARVAIETLPAEFRIARFIAQATGSHGLKPGIRIRLWCWLSRPTTGAELKYWLRYSPVDPSVFGAAHVIYTAAPVIAPGAFDPMPARLIIVPGNGEVVTPSPERLRPPPPPKRAETKNSDDISGLIHTVATAGGKADNRNNALYWAARRCAEHGLCDAATAHRLEQAAIHAGLPQKEAAATIKSGLRHG